MVYSSAANGTALLQNPKCLFHDSSLGTCWRLNEAYFSTLYTSSLMGSPAYESRSSSDKSTS